MAVARSAGTDFRPLIAISPDCRIDGSSPSESTYFVRMNYATALEQAGALPVILPYLSLGIGSVVPSFDGFLITGTTPGVSETPGRTKFERDLIEASIAARKPVLGICNGMQMIGLSLGARLIDALDSPGPGETDHLPRPVPTSVAHSVALLPRSRLGRLAGARVAPVNSLHRQAIEPGGEFDVVATAPDGVVEAIEGRGPGYVLGTQWHPEYQLTEFDRAIIADFVAAARTRAPNG